MFAKVFFLNLFADLHYDITLLDKHEAHSFRTVRLDPENSDEWFRFSQYGGVSFIRQPLAITVKATGFSYHLAILCFI